MAGRIPGLWDRTGTGQGQGQGQGLRHQTQARLAQGLWPGFALSEQIHGWGTLGWREGSAAKGWWIFRTSNTDVLLFQNSYWMCPVPRTLLCWHQELVQLLWCCLGNNPGPGQPQVKADFRVWGSLEMGTLELGMLEILELGQPGAGDPGNPGAGDAGAGDAGAGDPGAGAAWSWRSWSWGSWCAVPGVKIGQAGISARL